MIGVIEWELAGAITPKAKISVTDSAVATYTIPEGANGVSFQNQGTTKVWYGDSTVDPANNKGVYLLPGQVLTFKNAKSTFTIGFKCASGDSGTVGLVEID